MDYKLALIRNPGYGMVDDVVDDVLICRSPVMKAVTGIILLFDASVLIL